MAYLASTLLKTKMILGLVDCIEQAKARPLQVNKTTRAFEVCQLGLERRRLHEIGLFPRITKSIQSAFSSLRRLCLWTAGEEKRSVDNILFGEIQIDASSSLR